MAVKKIELFKKSANDKHKYYPKSSADIIDYDESLNVKDVLDTVIDSVDKVENRLQSSVLYMHNSNGELLTDSAGTGLIELL